MTLSAKLRSPAEWLAAMLFSGRKRSRRLVNCVILLFLLLPVLFIGTFSYLQSYRELTSDIFSRRQTLAYLTATTFKEKLDHVKDIGLSLATRVRFRQLIAEGKWSEAAEILRSVPKDFPFIDRLFITDPARTLVADMSELPSVRGKNFAYSDWYQGMSRSWQPYVSDVYKRAAEPQHNVIAVAIPIKAENQKIIGILVLQLPLQALLQWTADIEVGPSGFVYIVDRKGHVIAHPKLALEGDVVDVSTVPAVRSALSRERGIEVTWNPVEKEERIAAYEPVPDYGWGVIVHSDRLSRIGLRVRMGFQPPLRRKLPQNERYHPAPA